MYYRWVKVCPRCGLAKPLSRFNKNAGRKDGVHSLCKECRAQYDHERYERAQGRAVPRRRLRSERGRTAWLRSLKEDKPCADCERMFPHQVMQWDHRPGFEKLGDVSEDFWGCSREEILAEIAKCDLVCANCHAIRTFERAGWALKWMKEASAVYDAAWRAAA